MNCILQGQIKGANKELSNLSNYQKALANIGGRPRKNLLDNWYFAGGGSQQGGGQFPINQLGATSYPSENSKNRYTIDNWYFAGGGKLNILPECIEFPSDPTYRYLTTQQTFDLPVDGPYTISALTPDGGLEWRTISKLTNTGLTLSNGMYVYCSNENKIVIRTPQNQAVQLIAVGLEQGDGQTLGYQDSTGAWKLFETPDYLETLQQCQRYLYVAEEATDCVAAFGSNGLEFNFAIPVGVEMAQNLNISYSTLIGYGSDGIVFNSTGGDTFTPLIVIAVGNTVHVNGTLGVQTSAASQGFTAILTGLVITGTD